MSVSRTFSSFGLYDLLSNIIPGATVLITIAALFWPTADGGGNSTTPTLVIGIVLAFVVGRAVQAIASHFDDPRLFGETVDAIRGKSMNDPYELTEIEENFWEQCKKRFDLSDNFDSNERLIKMILGYLETTPETRALKFQAIWTFCRNMYMVGWITLALSFISLVICSLSATSTPSCWLRLLAVVIGLAEIGIFHHEKERFNEIFVKYIFTDFHIEMTK